jgi:hypothetical protein
VKLPVRVIVTTAVADPPCVTVADAGATESVNPPAACAAFTVSATVADAVVTPVPVAFTVTVAVPVVAVAAAVNVSVAEADADAIVVDATVTPVGNPVTATATSPVNPPERVRFTVTVLEAPCTTVNVEEESEMPIAGVVVSPVLSFPPHPASNNVAPSTAPATDHGDRVNDMAGSFRGK